LIGVLLEQLAAKKSDHWGTLYSSLDGATPVLC
jgi:hypothetical protein